VAYRDRHVDPRVSELEALIASEPDVRAEIARVRGQYDAATYRSDQVGPQLWEAERELEHRRAGGVIATVSAWFGRAHDEHERDVARLREEHAEITAEVTKLGVAERELSAKLTMVIVARAELERRVLDAVDALRALDGTDGDAVRSLDADDARDSAARVVIVRAIDRCDFARTALWTLDTIAQELAQVTGVRGSVMVVLQRIDSPTAVTDRERLRARIADAIDDASKRLDELVTRYDTTDLPWLARMPRRRVLELAASPLADPAEKTACVKNSEPLVACVTQLLEGLVAERVRLDRNHAEREARRRELAGRVRAQFGTM
jgi:hypothetical protein